MGGIGVRAHGGILPASPPSSQQALTDPLPVAAITGKITGSEEPPNGNCSHRRDGAARRPGRGRQPRDAAGGRSLRDRISGRDAEGRRLGKTPEGFGGGAGEDQFASFLVREQARAMVAAGGIGLSEVIFEAMKERQDG
jgi:hypothetical protein